MHVDSIWYYWLCLCGKISTLWKVNLIQIWQIKLLELTLKVLYFKFVWEWQKITLIIFRRNTPIVKILTNISSNISLFWGGKTTKKPCISTLLRNNWIFVNDPNRSNANRGIGVYKKLYCRFRKSAHQSYIIDS